MLKVWLLLVYYAWGQTESSRGQGGELGRQLQSSLTTTFGLMLLCKELFHVGHRPVGCLYGVPVEGAPEEVTDQEALVDELQEGASNNSLRLL